MRSSYSVGNENHPPTFLLMPTVQIPPLPLTWLSDTPVWVNQWPLKGKRLEKKPCESVKQQLEARHIEPSSSSWNTPIFVVPKKSGKWKLICDLRKINEILQPMGFLQPGVPNPACLPKDWPLLVIDIKDYFLQFSWLKRTEIDLLSLFQMLTTLNHCRDSTRKFCLKAC